MVRNVGYMYQCGEVSEDVVRRIIEGIFHVKGEAMNLAEAFKLAGKLEGHAEGWAECQRLVTRELIEAGIDREHITNLIKRLQQRPATEETLKEEV